VKSHDVRFWQIRRNRSSRRPSYEVRWTVGGRGRSKSFGKKALAEQFRADLMQASSRGDAFDVGTGLPVSVLRRRQSITWYELASDYLDMKWPKLAAKSRASTVDALATVTAVAVGDVSQGPGATILRRALVGHALNPNRRSDPRPPEVVAALRWLERRSLPVTELSRPAVVRQLLDGLSVTMTGAPAAATTVARKRAVLYNVLRYAVRERELLDNNPLDLVDWRAPAVADQVDRRVVVNPTQARELLAAVTYVGRTRGRRLAAFFGCLYFAGMRPAEAMALREVNCHLPSQGWGSISLDSSLPEAGKAYTDQGAVHDPRGLKHRARRDVRTIPIAPVLVVMLREHLDNFGTAPDGRLFATATGGVVSASAVWQVWTRARALGLAPHQVASPLAWRPYDLRHAAVSLWLNAGVPPREVAERVGHSVDVLWRVYAGCVDGDQERINRLIEAALS
jgi:integrase